MVLNGVLKVSPEVMIVMIQHRNLGGQKMMVICKLLAVGVLVVTRLGHIRQCSSLG